MAHGEWFKAYTEWVKQPCGTAPSSAQSFRPACHSKPGMTSDGGFALFEVISREEPVSAFTSVKSTVARLPLGVLAGLSSTTLSGIMPLNIKSSRLPLCCAASACCAMLHPGLTPPRAMKVTSTGPSHGVSSPSARIRWGPALRSKCCNIFSHPINMVPHMQVFLPLS